jgi:hypothetical protein
MKFIGAFLRYLIGHEFFKLLSVVSLGFWLGLALALAALDKQYHSRLAGFLAGATFLCGMGFTFHTLPETVGKMRCDQALYFGDALVLNPPLLSPPPSLPADRGPVPKPGL